MTRTLATVGIALILCLAVSGCTARPELHGRSGIVGTYRSPMLAAKLPETARVPAVIAAADETFRARGYSIRGKSGTEEVGTIVAVPPRTSDFPRVLVVASDVGDGTRVEISQQPFGDENLSRSVLDAILTKLGL